MDDTIFKENNENFSRQADIHLSIADDTRQMISLHQVLYENMIAQADSSCIGSAVQKYKDWWESYREQIIAYADVHEQAGRNLKDGVNLYDQIDSDIARVMTRFNDQMNGSSNSD